jgi:hypothetical protein
MRYKHLFSFFKRSDRKFISNTEAFLCKELLNADYKIKDIGNSTQTQKALSFFNKKVKQ